MENKFPNLEKLGQFASTAFCGNEILSSILYAPGVVIFFSGIYAPLIFILVAAILLIYKLIYSQIIEVFPDNGGVYNCLMNGISKKAAILVGIMTILAYVAIAVISAKTAVEYLNIILPVPVLLLGLLILFDLAIVALFGIKNSSKLALVIFVFHLVILTAFILLGLIYILKIKSYFSPNFAYTLNTLVKQNNLFMVLGLGFATAILGIIWFESPANFVCEQKKGIFGKILRNMIISFAIFYPLISFVILSAFPYESIIKAKNYILTDAAFIFGGKAFEYLVAADAFLILTGVVLTAYIGISGLVSRMAKDGSLPQFLSKQSSKNSYPFIIFGFFVICSLILILTKGRFTSLAGAYTFSFLGIMTLFILGSLVHKLRDKETKRFIKIPLVSIILAGLAVFIGIIADIKINPSIAISFAIYFIPAAILVLFSTKTSFISKILK